MKVFHKQPNVMPNKTNPIDPRFRCPAIFALLLANRLGGQASVCLLMTCRWHHIQRFDFENLNEA